MAALDQRPTPGQDPSHPAFYLPGQELNAGNFRGSWVVDPCRNDGESCDAGDQCCNGFCRAASGSDTGLVCGHKPPDGCANEFERCTTSSECCGYLPGGDGFVCVNDHCAQPPALPPIR